MASNFFKIDKGVTFTPQTAEPTGQNGDVYYNSTLNTFRKYENGAWRNFGSGGSGSGKNYLSVYTASTASGVANTGNGDFELGGTTGFTLGTVTLTSGLPTGVPTFGSGASGNLSLSTISSGQLAQLYSLGYVSSAATTAGNFVASDAFFIDEEDKAKVLGFKFFYKAAVNPTNGNFSGTSSNSFGVAIYDVTNSAWIIPAGVFNFVQNSGTGICQGSFQTSATGTQYRIVVYNVTATAGAITMYFDDFFVGPQNFVSAPAMTDWVAYTPTFVGAGTVTGASFFWRRVGDMLEVQGFYTYGTPTGSIASFTLPAGFVLDPAKIGLSTNLTSDNAAPAWGHYSETSGIEGGKILTATGTSTTLVYFSGIAGAGQSIAPVVGTTAFPNTNRKSFLRFAVPIASWSSNSSMSNDTDTRVVAACATHSATLAVTANNVIAWTTTSFDTHNGFSAGVYTVPVSGIYDCNLIVAHTGGASSNHFLNKNGVSVGRIVANGSGVLTAGGFPVQCVAGDTLSIVSGSSVTIDYTAPSGVSTGLKAFFSVIRRSGPAVVAAAEKVYLQYTGNAAGTLTANTTNIDWTTKVVDSHGAWSGTVFTAPRSGWYDVKGAVKTSANLSAGTLLQLYVNTVLKTTIGYGSGSLINSISGSIYLLAGDALSIRSDGTPTLSNSAVQHHIDISSQG